jgi:hypothetical protein
MNLKVCVVKHWSWLILRLLARRLRERAVENEENFNENKPAFGPKFQLGNYRKHSSSANYSNNHGLQ